MINERAVQDLAAGFKEKLDLINDDPNSVHLRTQLKDDIYTVAMVVRRHNPDYRNVHHFYSLCGLTRDDLK